MVINVNMELWNKSLRDAQVLIFWFLKHSCSSVQFLILKAAACHTFIPLCSHCHIKPYYLTPSSCQVCLPSPFSNIQSPVPLLPSLFICITKSSLNSPSPSSAGIKSTGSKDGRGRVERRTGLTKWNSIWQQQRPLVRWYHDSTPF